MNKQLTQIYYDPSHPASFAGPDKLYQVVKGKYTRAQVARWFKKQESYSLTHPARRKFPRSRVVTAGLDDIHDADLMDMGNLAKDNDGVRFVLVNIDIFSRYLWTRPLKSKQGPEVAKELTSIYAEGRIPNVIRTDAGTEFFNRWVKTILTKNSVGHLKATNEPKANYAERVIKTIKMKITRYMIHNNTHHYIDQLASLTKSYNDTQHSSIGRPPSMVTKDSEAEVLYDAYRLRRKRSKITKAKFSVDDIVRISHVKKIFDKEYSQKWTGELFKIGKILKRDDMHVYVLKDWDGEWIKGAFYSYELQRFDADENTVFKIEKILKRRTRRGVKEVLVHWLHWPSTYDSWIPAKHLKRYS